MEAQFEQVDVTDAGEEVVDVFRHEAEQKGVDLRLDAPNEPVYAALDDRYYEQILDNLIGNAVKFTDEGHITVEIEEDDEAVQIQVRDTGAGIDEEFLPHLFEDFKQESSGLDREHGGSGLGLAITARLVKLMHGTIEVESEKGVGTTFTIRFPKHTPEKVDSMSNGEKADLEDPSYAPKLERSD